MKKAIKYLSGMKSRYFMLLACLILLVAATSCSSDEFETNLPEETKQLSKAELLQKYSKAELIEQALSRMPKTRVEGNGVMMITIKDSVNFKVKAIGNMTITWENLSTSEVKADGIEHDYPHVYTNGNLSHIIWLSGSAQALQSLNIDDNGLILLEIYSNENLITLSCMNNHLEEIQLPNVCPALQALHVSNNEFSTIEVARLPMLYSLYAKNNQLTYIDVSDNPNLSQLILENNKITDINLLGNSNLTSLNLSFNPIKELDLSNNSKLINIELSNTSITDLDLTNIPNLVGISLEGLSIKTINNLPVNDRSFAGFPKLMFFNVAYTSFDSLDLSNNTMIYSVNISGSTIMKLDISGVRVCALKATRSKLINLKCTEEDLLRLSELRIEYTPFEKDSTNMSKLGSALPQRTVKNPGHLYTYSKYIYFLNGITSTKNWLINQ